MRYLGKSSVASFLRIALSVVWVMGIALIVFLVVGSILLIVFGPPQGACISIGSSHDIVSIGFTNIQSHPKIFTLQTDFLQVEFMDAVIKNSKQLILGFLSLGIIMVGLGMAIIYQLRKILTTLEAGTPFVIENVNRIRKIGLLIFGGIVAQFIAGLFLGRAIMENVIVKGTIFTAKSGFNGDTIFIALVILVIAEIFRQGTLLKEEHDLTI
ncbi:MAG TPA: hypothetical protein DDW65_24125 [Firmicutes bacterium]|jgi:hypothetical protein|nr:hypothetical protein [Bacillota bacterium]